eukprot:scaffold14406_cov66-Skeletonema_marinoi.AAC.2
MRILLNGYDGDNSNVGSHSSGLDCPWCLLAKQLLQDEYQLDNDTLQIIELEDLGQEENTFEHPYPWRREEQILMMHRE